LSFEAPDIPEELSQGINHHPLQLSFAEVK
jgi:hypothetical protein